jgi:DNA-binding NarL/FixJ family response regulator
LKKYSDIQVAIADNHNILRKGVIALLQEHDIAVTIEAKNGLELISRLENTSELPDICILDIRMPELDGFDTISILTKRWPKIKKLVFTGICNRHSVIKTLSVGADGYLVKDADTKELYKAVCDLHDYGYYQSALEIEYFSKKRLSLLEFKKELFTSREISFIKYCCTELTYKEIADKMNVSLRTVDGYRNELFSRLKVKSRIGVVMYALNSEIPFTTNQ